MNRGRRREEVFTCKQDYKVFVELLQETVEKWNLRVSSYCLMPNHYHLFVQTPDSNISRCMRHIDGVYTQRFNRAHGYDGQLFRGRYKAMLVDASTYMLYLVRYIHRNPQRAGLVENPSQYLWSSHRGYVSNAKKWDWLHKNVVLGKFGKGKTDQIKKYKEFVAHDDKEELLKILESTRWPATLGSKSFIEKIKERFFGDKTVDYVPQSRELAPEINKIKETVCAFYGIDTTVLHGSRRGVWNEPRNMAVYLSRRLRNDSLSLIGSHFNFTKFSSVSSAVDRMDKLISKDSALRKKMLNLINAITKSQEYT